MSYITAKIGKLPGKINSFSFDEGVTVRSALNSAEIDADGYEVRVNDTLVEDLTTSLPDGATVLLSRKIKGNQDAVKAGKLPGRLHEYAVDHGSTVRDVLNMAELDADGYEIRIGDSLAEMGTVVTDGDTILLSRKIKGN